MQDRARTDAYRDAILFHADFIRDKVGLLRARFVLRFVSVCHSIGGWEFDSLYSVFGEQVVMDVGCGTGILSIFCAFAGARKASSLECRFTFFHSPSGCSLWKFKQWWNFDGNTCILHVRCSGFKLSGSLSFTRGFMFLMFSGCFSAGILAEVGL